jgi:hypothetical protein
MEKRTIRLYYGAAAQIVSAAAQGKGTAGLQDMAAALFLRRGVLHTACFMLYL